MKNFVNFSCVVRQDIWHGGNSMGGQWAGNSKYFYTKYSENNVLRFDSIR